MQNCLSNLWKCSTCFAFKSSAHYLYFINPCTVNSLVGIHQTLQQWPILVELAGWVSGQSLSGLLDSASVHLTVNQRLGCSFSHLSLPYPSSSRDYPRLWVSLSLTKVNDMGSHTSMVEQSSYLVEKWHTNLGQDTVQSPHTPSCKGEHCFCLDRPGSFLILMLLFYFLKLRAQ